MADKNIDIKIKADAGNTSSELKKVSSEVEKLGASAENTTKKTGKAFSSLDDQLQGLKNRLSAVLALQLGDIVSNQLGRLGRVADGYKNLQARLGLVSDNQDEFNIAMRETARIANDTFAPLDETAKLYGKIETAVKQLGGSQETALARTETIAQAIAIANEGAVSSSAGLQQFGQALASGVLRGDEFNSVMENTPALAQALADGLGVPITQLRTMAEAGELTADRIINALGNAAPKVAEQFAKVPLTISRAWTLVENQFQTYIGTADAAYGASANLANGIKFIADNFGPLASTAASVAVIYGITLVQGLVKSGAAMLDNAAAARAKMIADRELLAGEVMLAKHQLQLALSNKAAAKSALDLALAEQKAAKGFIEAALATQKARAAIDAYRVSAADAATKTAALNALTTKTAVATTLAQRGAGLLTRVLGGFLKLEVIKIVAGWALKLDLFRTASLRAQEGLVMLATGFAGLLKGGLDWDKRRQELADIHAEFNKIIKDGPKKLEQDQAAANAELDKATELVNVQASAIEKLTETYTALADATKAAADAQLSAIDDTLTDKLRSINSSTTDAGNVDRSIERERLTTQAILEAERERTAIREQSARDQIRVIDDAHNRAVEAAKKANQSTEKLDKDWLDSKYNVLRGWQSSTRQTVDQLIALEAKHRDAAIAIDNERLAHKRKIEDLIKEIQGKNDINTPADLSRARADAIALQRELNDARKTQGLHDDLAAAKKVEEEYIKIAQSTKDLFDKGLVDQSAIDISVYNLRQAARQVDDIQAKQSDEQRAAQEEARVQLASVNKTLADINSSVDGLIAKARQALTLKIQTDTAALDAAIEKINSIPDEKTVVIKTVNEAGNPVESPIKIVPGHSKGFRFSGYGGGDRHFMAAEDGEVVLNKESVREFDQALGPGFLDNAIAGANPVELLRNNFSAPDFSPLSINIPKIDSPKFANAGSSGEKSLHLHLPDGRGFGPFRAAAADVDAVEAAIKTEALRFGRRK
ncbi:MAG: tape measure protein [Gammaproteobacteria bacterium]